MPVIEAARKSMRQDQLKKKRNLAWKKKLKELLKELQDLISQEKTKEAKKLLPKVYKVLDKSAKAGIIKKGAADRKKSRLARKIS